MRVMLVGNILCLGWLLQCLPEVGEKEAAEREREKEREKGEKGAKTKKRGNGDDEERGKKTRIKLSVLCSGVRAAAVAPAAVRHGAAARDGDHGELSTRERERRDPSPTQLLLHRPGKEQTYSVK